MAVRTIIRGDSYALRRPLYTYTLTTEISDVITPFNLSGCTIRTTYRSAPATVTDDPNDSTAVWKGTLVIASNGTVTSSDGLVLKGGANEGIVEVHLTATASRAFPTDVELISDLEITDAQGEKFTFLSDEKVKAVDGVTHRTTE